MYWCKDCDRGFDEDEVKYESIDNEDIAICPYCGSDRIQSLTV